MASGRCSTPTGLFPGRSSAAMGAWQFPSTESLLVALAHEIPVDHLEEGSHVIRAAVLVFEVVGVLPDINPEQRLLVLAGRRVLVGRRLDAQLLVGIEDQPSPATAELTQCGFGEFVFEGAKSAKPLLNRSEEHTSELQS